MKTHSVKVGSVTFGGNRPFVFISGPCVIESEASTLNMARKLKEITSSAGVPFVFKASFDKANRTSISSFRGPGLDKGLDILAKVKAKLGVPVLSDVHDISQIKAAAEVLDIIQIPAFLCRQTDLILAAGETGRVVNIKKGQFLAPWDVAAIVNKVPEKNRKNILLTDRGTTFGYNNLVSDFRGLQIMRETGCPVVFDASHSVQQPGGLGTSSGGRSEFIPLLARCALAAGCDAIFMETHTDPKKALSDGPNMLAISQVPALLKILKAIDKVVKS
jgi:2-dehydro-3-deoxyphosphooctonate aldolase (KDO 8-P synthase)